MNEQLMTKYPKIRNIYSISDETLFELIENYGLGSHLSNTYETNVQMNFISLNDKSVIIRKNDKYLIMPHFRIILSKFGWIKYDILQDIKISDDKTFMRSYNGILMTNNEYLKFVMDHNNFLLEDSRLSSLEIFNLIKNDKFSMIINFNHS